jgi:hypothetical protein
VGSVIFSFQELYALVMANPSSHYVKFSNIGESIPVNINGTNVNFTKHSVIVGPSDLPPSKTATVQGSGAYFNVYADLVALCPPDCGTITYQLQ